MPETRLSRFLASSGPAVLVEIEAVKGSSPRAAGTFMLVAENLLWETIGGGQFEYMAIDHARAMLRSGAVEDSMDIPLGPEIGQCCGGRTLLRFQRVTTSIANQLEQRLMREEQAQPAVFILAPAMSARRSHRHFHFCLWPSRSWKHARTNWWTCRKRQKPFSRRCRKLLSPLFPKTVRRSSSLTITLSISSLPKRRLRVPILPMSA